MFFEVIFGDLFPIAFNFSSPWSTRSRSIDNRGTGLLQAAAYHLVRMSSWYQPFRPANSQDYACLENYAVFAVSMFQYIGMAVAYSQGAPYRASMLTNRWFTASLLLMAAVCAYITLWPATWVVAALQLVVPPAMDFRVLCVALGAANLALCLFFEKAIVQWLVQRKLRYCCHDVTKSRRKYLAVDRELCDDLCWPPLADVVALAPGAGGALLLTVSALAAASPEDPADPHPPRRATVRKTLSALSPAQQGMPTVSQLVSDGHEVTKL